MKIFKEYYEQMNESKRDITLKDLPKDILNVINSFKFMNPQNDVSEDGISYIIYFDKIDFWQNDMERLLSLNKTVGVRYDSVIDGDTAKYSHISISKK
jgi:hypothetical protein